MIPTPSIHAEMEHRNPQLVTIPQENCLDSHLADQIYS